MKIHGIANAIYRKQDSETLVKKESEGYAVAYGAIPRTDRIDISAKAYGIYSDDEDMTATSGKDSLGITKGDKEGSFMIHFSDSAIVSRAVSRGYLTVNGTNIELTDDVKQQLTKMDQKAQADREQAFNEYIMQHELAVAQQQGESYKKMADDMSQALQTAAKLSKGAKVSPSEERQLLESNPQLYATSKIVSSMVKQPHNQSEGIFQMPEINQEASQAPKGVDSSSIEWKSYETRLTVSLSDTVQLLDVSEGEIDMRA